MDLRVGMRTPARRVPSDNDDPSHAATAASLALPASTRSSSPAARDGPRRRAPRAPDRARARAARAGGGMGAHRRRPSTRSVAKRRRRAPRGEPRDRLSAGAAGRAARGRHRARDPRRIQVVIVCGETGSGKTTQLPKICLAAGRGERGLIGHTQPRRIAARAVATRIAQELRQPSRRGRRLQGPLHRPHAARRVRQADDRRHPARGDAGRPRCSPPTTRSSSTRRTSAASTSISCWAT